MKPKKRQQIEHEQYKRVVKANLACPDKSGHTVSEHRGVTVDSATLALGCWTVALVWTSVAIVMTLRGLLHVAAFTSLRCFRLYADSFRHLRRAFVCRSRISLNSCPLVSRCWWTRPRPATGSWQRRGGGQRETELSSPCPLQCRWSISER